MATANIRSSGLDGHVSHYTETDYAVAQAAANADFVSNTTIACVGQQYPYATTKYWISRVVVYFDLSSLGSNITVTVATLTITCDSDYSTENFTIRLVNGSGAEDVLVVADYGDLRVATTAIANTITTDTWTGTKTFTLNATGLALLSGSTTGYKKLCLRSEEDINASAPTTHERVYVATGSPSVAEANRPLLAITYTLGGLPTVTTQAMSDVVTTTATGNSNVTDLGDSAVTQHGHCWNTTGTPDTDDTKTTNGAKAATGAFTSSLTGLTSGTLYYVRAYATNTAGTSYGGQVAFWAGAVGSGEGSGAYAVVETRFHYVDAYGHERGGELPLI